MSGGDGVVREVNESRMETWPDMRALELLIRIADTGSLGVASRSVGIAQPYASRIIRNLESNLGVTLVARSPRGSTLTAEGAVVCRLARAVLDDARKVLGVADSMRRASRSAISIAASMTIAECLLPNWLVRFRQSHPEVQVQLQMHNSSQVLDSLASQRVNLGFIECPVIPTRFHSTAVAHDRLVVVVDPRHPWARRRGTVSAQELAETRLVTREPGSGTRETLDAALGAHPRSEPLVELASSVAIRASVLAGVGPAVISALAVHDDLRKGSLRCVDVDVDLTRTLRAVWRPPRRLEGLLGELMNDIVSSAGVAAGPGAAHAEMI